VLSGLVDVHALTPGQFPEWVLSAGLLSGAKQFTWLDGNTGDPSATLTKVTELRYSFEAGLSATHVGKLTDVYGLSVEAYASLESKFDASSAKARVCVQQGTVSGAPAEQCSETTLGAPTGTAAYGLGIDVGVVDTIDARWRAAFGLLWKPTTPGKPASFALHLPLYVSLASVPAGYAGEYKGLLRVTPSVSFSRDPVLGIVPSGFVTVDALGDMNMFPGVLDAR
jgi:hypothetical protein